jgi:hypothetical protein
LGSTDGAHLYVLIGLGVTSGKYAQ